MMLLLVLVQESAADFRREVRPLLEAYCVKCHGGAKPKGGLDLGGFADEASVLSKRRVWDEAMRKLADGEMPPEGKPAPKPEERKLLLAWYRSAVDRHDAAAPRDPGRPGFRRLNRTEYNRTVRDLLGADLRPGDEFPSDDTAHGFDTIGDALALPPLLVEKVFDAAERILDQLLLPEPKARSFEGGSAAVEFPASGKYHLKAKGGAKAEFRVEGKPVEATIYAARGTRKVEVEGAAGFEVAGPISPPGLPEARKRIFFARPGPELPAREAARQVLERFATRAFRRPVSQEELERLLGLFDRAAKRGEAFETALRGPLVAVLCSPHFLFRIERDRPGSAPWRLGDHEVAVRLSYFLWSTMPDERLSELAGQGKLSDPAVVEGEVGRMLKDPRASALVENFLYQWLQVDAFRHANPDNRVFPEFHKDWRIRRGMEDELRRFVEGVAKEDRPLLDLIDADYTYVNEATARWYGLPDVKGDPVRKVSLPDRRRGGLLTMGAVLVMTSSPDRTSVVKRGKWVLEKILGTPPPPPPENVEELKKEGKAAAPTTLRERMARHRADPSCATCHQRIDPLGFGLEAFDGVGRWREEEAGKPVDATGTLPGGRSFDGPVGLKDILLERKDEFAKSVAERLLIYALGRGLEDGDAPAVREIVERAKRGGYRWSALVAAVAASHPFLHRRNETAKGEAR
jgi:hypothetical protein